MSQKSIDLTDQIKEEEKKQLDELVAKSQMGGLYFDSVQSMIERYWSGHGRSITGSMKIDEREIIIEIMRCFEKDCTKARIILDSVVAASDLLRREGSFIVYLLVDKEIEEEILEVRKQHAIERELNSYQFSRLSRGVGIGGVMSGIGMLSTKTVENRVEINKNKIRIREKYLAVTLMRSFRANWDTVQWSIEETVRAGYIKRDGAFVVRVNKK